MTDDSPNADRYLILLEQIQGQVQLLAEGHSQLDSKIDAVRSDLMATEHRLNKRIEGAVRFLSARIDHNSEQIRCNTEAIQLNSEAIRLNSVNIIDLKKLIKKH